MKRIDLVSAVASTLVSLQRERGRAMTRGEDWADLLKNELVQALGLIYRVDWRTARESVDAELAAAEDPIGLLEELVLRHRLAVTLYDTEPVATALACVS